MLALKIQTRNCHRYCFTSIRPSSRDVWHAEPATLGARGVHAIAPDELDPLEEHAVSPLNLRLLGVTRHKPVWPLVTTTRLSHASGYVRGSALCLTWHRSPPSVIYLSNTLQTSKMWPMPARSGQRAPEMKYMRIVEVIRERIASGEYDGKIPSQSELLEQFDASHMTVRRALAVLISEGHLYSLPGKGIYSFRNKNRAEIRGSVGFSDQMKRLNATVTSRVIEARVIPASTAIAGLLGLEVNDRVYRIERVRVVDGEPVAIQRSSIRHKLCPGILEHDLEKCSLFELFRTEYHLLITGGRGSVEARLAEQEELRLLELEPPQPVLVTERITMQADGEPLEFVESVYRGDRYRLDLNE